jgi:cytochrome P450
MTDTIEIDRAKILDVDLYGAVKRNPYKYYMEWNKVAPFYILSEGHPQAVFTKLEDTRTVLNDYSRFSSYKRPYPGTEGFYFFNAMPTVTDSDPPVHTRRRRLMMPALTPRKLVQIEAGVNTAVDKVLDRIEESGPQFDLVSDLCKPLAYNTLLGLVCGLPEQDWPIFTGFAQAQRAAFAQLDVNPEAKAAYQNAWDEAMAYCTDLMESRRRNPTDDLVSNMLAALGREDSQLTTEEVMATLIILFSAGLGGVTSTPAWALWRLARHADQMSLLQADPSLITGTITESIRMEPSSFASIRYVVGNFEFAGLTLLDGMPVHTLSAGGNYDSERYPDPLRFDITRPTDWLALSSFGHGVHHCIGNAVARLGARITVAKTVQRFPKLRLQEPDVLPQIEGVIKQRSAVSIPVAAH